MYRPISTRSADESTRRALIEQTEHTRKSTRNKRKRVEEEGGGYIGREGGYDGIEDGSEVEGGVGGDGVALVVVVVVVADTRPYPRGSAVLHPRTPALA